MSFVRLRKHFGDMMLLEHLRKLHSFLWESRIEKRKTSNHIGAVTCVFVFLVWDLVGWTLKAVLNTMYAFQPLRNL